MKTETLDFEYHEGAGCAATAYQIADYRGLQVRVFRDDSPQNPFEDWDCEPPLYAYFGRNGERGYNLSLETPTLTRAQILEHKAEILAALGGMRSFLEIVREYWGAWGAYDAVECVNDAISAHADDLHTADRLDFLADVWRWHGCESLATSVSGYSQGDWADLLIVATPEWAEKVGAPPETHARQLKSAARLYESWAFGDVYGYLITDENGDDAGGCWGFYGADHEESGLAESARDEIDAEIERRRKARLVHTKTMIRNNVPLAARA